MSIAAGDQFKVVVEHPKPLLVEHLTFTERVIVSVYILLLAVTSEQEIDLLTVKLELVSVTVTSVTVVTTVVALVWVIVVYVTTGASVVTVVEGLILKHEQAADRREDGVPGVIQAGVATARFRYWKAVV